MKTITTDKYSFARAAALWRLASPGMGLHLAITAGITVLCYGLALLSTYDISVGLYTLSAFIVLATFYCGPLHFARFRDKTFAAQIPATAGERTTVVTLYTFVLIPAVIIAAWFASKGIAALFSDNYDVNAIYLNSLLNDKDLTGMRALAQNPGLSVLQKLQEIVPTGVCLYVVVCSRRSPVVHGLLGIVCALFAMSLVGGVYGVVLAFKSGIADAAAGRDFNPQGFIDNFTEGISGMIYAIGAFSIAALGVLIWLLYRKFSKRRV